MRPYQKPIRTAIAETLDLLADSKVKICALTAAVNELLEALVLVEKDITWQPDSPTLKVVHRAVARARETVK
jgi:hypothetical protein